MINPSQTLQTKPEELLLDELDELEDELEPVEPSGSSGLPPHADKPRVSKIALKNGKLARKSRVVLIIGSPTNKSNDMIIEY
jgi:hypothetical protein